MEKNNITALLQSLISLYSKTPKLLRISGINNSQIT